jgi:hypothetical protein
VTTDPRPLSAAYCANCGEDTVLRLPDDWQTQVNAGAAIPIVGCGNPWHYADHSLGDAPAPLGVEEAIAQGQRMLAASEAAADREITRLRAALATPAPLDAPTVAERIDNANALGYREGYRAGEASMAPVVKDAVAMAQAQATPAPLDVDEPDAARLLGFLILHVEAVHGCDHISDGIRNIATPAPLRQYQPCEECEAHGLPGHPVYLATEAES